MYEICEKCLCKLEGTKGQIQVYEFETELKLMDQAMNASLEEHPDFLELMDIAKKESLRYKKKPKTNQHFDVNLTGMTAKKFPLQPFDKEKNVILLDDFLLDLLWINLTKRCLCCRKEKRRCVHLVPGEFEIFWRLMQASKGMFVRIKEWMDARNIGPVRIECLICSTNTLSKARMNVPLSKQKNWGLLGQRYPDSRVISQISWVRFLQHIECLGIKVYNQKCHTQGVHLA